MPDHPSPAATAAPPRPLPVLREARTDWRLGGRTVRRWREGLLGIALISLGASVVAAAALRTLVGGTLADLAATGLLIAGLAVPVVWAFSRSRPVGLLRFHPVDLIYGLAIGILVLLVQGWAETATGGSGALPAFAGGMGGPDWMLRAVVADGLVLPVAQEMLFRGVILVSLYTLMRRPLGRAAAAGGAVAGAAALSVLSAWALGGLGADAVIGTGALAVATGLAVVLTGRIWGAVAIHLVFAWTYLALAAAGTILA